MRRPTKQSALCHFATLCLLLWGMGLFAQYPLRIQYINKDSAFDPAALQLQTDFAGQLPCLQYVDKLTGLLRGKGYPTASVDSIHTDTAHTAIQLYVGKRYQWVRLLPDSIEKTALEQSGYLPRDFSGKPLNITCCRASSNGC
jgi:hypothetical protein